MGGNYSLEGIYLRRLVLVEVLELVVQLEAGKFYPLFRNYYRIPGGWLLY